MEKPKGYFLKFNDWELNGKMRFHIEIKCILLYFNLCTSYIPHVPHKTFVSELI